MRQDELGPVAPFSETTHGDEAGEAVGPERAAAAARGGSAPDTGPAEPDVVIEDLLVEDISIDGMCGVY